MEPLKHEIEAAELMSKQSRVLLFDAMGVGKTVSTLLALQRLKNSQNGPFRVVVCVPNTIAGQWAEECSVWLSWNCLVAWGDRTEREKQYFAFKTTTDYPILITTYGNFTKDKFFQEFMADCLVLDEGWLFRNRNTKLYCQLQQVIPKYDKCYLLSGNFESFNDRQFYSLVDLMFPDQYRLTDKITLSKQLGDLFLSRDFMILLEPTQKMFEMVLKQFSSLDCSSEQWKLYNDVCLEENRAIKAGAGASVLRNLLNKKVAVLNSQRLIDSGLDFSPKEYWITSRVNGHAGKCVVYCPDRKFFDLLAKDFSSNLQSDFVCVSGKMSAKIRTRNLGVFQNDPNCKCLLLAGIGKFGLNLQCADLLIFANVPKSLFEWQQLVGRLVRIRQKSVVSCEIPYMSGTYEAALVKKVFG